MRLLPLSAATATLLCSLYVFPSTAPAQNPAGANATKFGIGVVDVGYIFKKHERFRDTMESMKKEMETIEQQLKAKRDQVAQKEQQRNSYKVGSPEYKQLDDELARSKADFNLEMTRLRKDFLEREGKVYYQTYLEVDNAVKYYAERHNIGLVFRFNGEAPDPNRREDVLRAINKPVVFQNRIDITPDVLTLLNRQGGERVAQPPATGNSQIPGRR